MDNWYVYIVRCVDGSFYTGIAKDVQKRLKEHNGGSRGARYTRTRRPVVLVYTQMAGSVGAALRRERQIKKMSRKDKENLIIC